MIIVRILILIVLISYSHQINSFLKNNIMKWIAYLFTKIKNTGIRFYRILNIKKRSEFVWNDLLKFNQNTGWSFGQFESEKRIENTFAVDDDNSLDFHYIVTEDELEFKAIILKSFDVERTNDILVLAAHFNSLLTLGIVRVNTKYNFIEYTYYGDLINYMLFWGEIESNQVTHFNLTQDIFWSYNNMLELGDDPVFVFSELLRRKKEEKDKNS